MTVKFAFSLRRSCRACETDEVCRRQMLIFNKNSLSTMGNSIERESEQKVNVFRF